jgi:hypothetical protein
VRMIAAPPANRNAQDVGPAGSEKPAIDHVSEQLL